MALSPPATAVITVNGPVAASPQQKSRERMFAIIGLILITVPLCGFDRNITQYFVAVQGLTNGHNNLFA